ncbi:hypothetical protein H4582DRAFT_1982709 [Lactarius indigo]|nr:hypothetical protein H4582DRAFT_1982709 [Lactarius indigo]
MCTRFDPDDLYIAKQAITTSKTHRPLRSCLCTSSCLHKCHDPADEAAFMNTMNVLQAGVGNLGIRSRPTYRSALPANVEGRACLQAHVVRKEEQEECGAQLVRLTVARNSRVRHLNLVKTKTLAKSTGGFTALAQEIGYKNIWCLVILCAKYNSASCPTSYLCFLLLSINRGSEEIREPPSWRSINGDEACESLYWYREAPPVTPLAHKSQCGKELNTSERHCYHRQ